MEVSLIEMAQFAMEWGTLHNASGATAYEIKAAYRAALKMKQEV